MMAAMITKATLTAAFAASVLLCNSPADTPRVEFAAPFAPSEDWVKPSEKPYRQGICLNGLWQFQPVAMRANFNEGWDPAPELTPPTAEGWEKTPIRIPSPWNVNSFAEFGGSGCDLRTYPSYPKQWEKVKMGWLRKNFTVPADWKGMRIQLHFSAVAGDVQILLNGKKLATQFGIFFPFDVDITDAIVAGKDNELLVGVRKPSLLDVRSKGGYGFRPYQAGSFWGPHIAGIWDDVYLVGLPAVRIIDTQIKPQLDSDTLEAELTLRNDGDKEAKVSLSANASLWISKAGKDLITAANPSCDLEKQPALKMPEVTATVLAHGEAKVVLSSKVKEQLKKWSPEHPNLYGLVVHTKLDGKIVDSKYTRFGWRQFTMQGSQYLLNGKPIVMKGDSWHFMGIAQMTRRYPYAWFTALRAANLNAVRLHAEPYPSFYLDVADEMGILVLDETAIWASDGGPKLDSDAFWQDSIHHLSELVMRDRNHPSIFGWSVSNEVEPVVVGVFRNPPGMKEKLFAHYDKWVEVCRKLDPTRPWISADGERDGDGKLPTCMIHYGGEREMLEAAGRGKPWGVGEAGFAYYGTPAQVSSINGDRAYESFQGRMEGVAGEAYQHLVNQGKHNASYRSIFNLAWYGLKPLPLGMNNVTRPPTLEDGVYFTAFEEGKPGVQPERLGPYSTTFNPGYVGNMPLYETWPLFDAIRDASAEPPVPCKWVTAPQPKATPAPEAPRVSSARVLSGSNGKLAMALKVAGVPLEKLDTTEVPELLFIDGANPPTREARLLMDQVFAKKGTVCVWGGDPKTLNALNELLPAPLRVTSRKASSLVLGPADPITAGLTPAGLYYSELPSPGALTQGLSGPLLYQSTVLLKACDTEWLKWNQQPEAAKTAMIIRSECEETPSGAALILKKQGEGRLIVTTLPILPDHPKKEKTLGVILSNLGLTVGSGQDSGKPLLKTGRIVRALMCASFPIISVEEATQQNLVDPAQGELIRASAKVDGKPWTLINSDNGAVNFGNLKFTGPKENAAAYLSFWVASPRDLTDLLTEPNLPSVGLEVAADDAIQVWLNGKEVLRTVRTGPIDSGKAKADGLKLRKGWNHFLIKVTQASGGWEFMGHLTCTQPEYLPELDSAFEKP